LGGAADADAEEALVEVELNQVVRPLDVADVDCRAGGDVPDVLAVLLQKVGDALRLELLGVTVVEGDELSHARERISVVGGQLDRSAGRVSAAVPLR
jgi:hypothetical protein